MSHDEINARREAHNLADARLSGAQDLIFLLTADGQLSNVAAAAARKACEPLKERADAAFKAYMEALEGHFVVAEVRVIKPRLMARNRRFAAALELRGRCTSLSFRRAVVLQSLAFPAR